HGAPVEALGEEEAPCPLAGRPASGALAPARTGRPGRAACRDRTTERTALMLLPPLIALMLASGAACSFLWIGAEIGRRTSVKGSQPRYVWASIERGLRYPALLYFSISAAVEAAIYK